MTGYSQSHGRSKHMASGLWPLRGETHDYFSSNKLTFWNRRPELPWPGDDQ